MQDDTVFTPNLCVFRCLVPPWFHLVPTWARKSPWRRSDHSVQGFFKFYLVPGLVPLGCDIGPQFLQAHKRYVPQVRDNLCPLPHKSGHSPGPRLRSPGGYLYSVYTLTFKGPTHPTKNCACSMSRALAQDAPFAQPLALATPWWRRAPLQTALVMVSSATKNGMGGRSVGYAAH